ncbi:GspE/PulE family protein [Patescibacteria group bacterium]|nr:GspE/PulE family protein [Patescibacteria group bacterium]MDE1946352.1 type II/IV secretion system protein [Patescibacteria group bacterium]MDE2010804.1 type II/IV secretion system protein [Patescibacteria group bacterium]MDE2233263.1 type II/IV secretion system protein [Patescibacteria group bacterium]
MVQEIQADNAVTAIDTLLERAVKTRASDIHIDPRDDDTMVRFRIDGVIEPIGALPARLHEEMIARLKILSGSRTDVHFMPQDGRWKANVSGEDYNVRISFMPTYYGENAVIRLLPSRAASGISFAKLGFTPEHVRIIAKTLEKPSGLVLATGPTGSGKTTTLHACLSLKAREPLSIITLEDPVEYEIPDVRQVHIRHDYGVTFASGLRAALRQDPDIIMVGEIRDSETARVAIHTALTGHLVFSTLHTNSAMEAIPRLLDMGVDHYLLASTLRLLIAQRLIRDTCRECFAGGCECCRNTGYSGRSAIVEVCEVDNHMREMIGARAPLSDIVESAHNNGFRGIEEDGAEKVDWGVTTKEEIMRVLYL